MRGKSTAIVREEMDHVKRAIRDMREAVPSRVAISFTTPSTSGQHRAGKPTSPPWSSGST